MRPRYWLAAVLAATALQAPVQAQRTPSLQIRCDGQPDNVTAGETAARLIGAVTLLGLFAPEHETADSSQRLPGAEGVAICNQALAVESNDVRRAQLILATALHQIEAGDHAAALTEIGKVRTDRPALADTAAFRHSLGLAATDVEAIALVRAGRMDEARAKAFEMAAAAPYDLIASARALRFVRLSPTFGPAEEAFFANLIRLFPLAVSERAFQRQLAGDFRGSTADYDLWQRYWSALSDKPSMTILAHSAMANALAGDAERAEQLAGQAREAMAAEPESAGVSIASEILDLYQIWKSAKEGRVADARLLFGARTTWLRPTAPAVSAVARLLQEGAQPDQLPGSLAGASAHWVDELLARRLADINEDKDHFDAVRAYFPQANYDRFAANVWRSGRSRYFAREDDERIHGRFITVSRDGYGTPASYALLLHAALTAQREGKTSFMLMAPQVGLGRNVVRFGNEGDEQLIAPMALDAGQVIADLGPLIAQPQPRR